MGNSPTADFPTHLNDRGQDNQIGHYYCPFGHEVQRIQSGVQVFPGGMILGTNQQGFCVTCRKVYDLGEPINFRDAKAYVALTLKDSTGHVIHRQLGIQDIDFLSSETLGFVRAVEREAYGKR
jgi:hypothetical protein